MLEIQPCCSKNVGNSGKFSTVDRKILENQRFVVRKTLEKNEEKTEGTLEKPVEKQLELQGSKSWIFWGASLVSIKKK